MHANLGGSRQTYRKTRRASGSQVRRDARRQDDLARPATPERYDGDLAVHEANAHLFPWIWVMYRTREGFRPSRHVCLPMASATALGLSSKPVADRARAIIESFGLVGMYLVVQLVIVVSVILTAFALECVLRGSSVPEAKVAVTF
jgi:hypothetical protein